MMQLSNEQVKYVTTRELLSGNWFKIPDYQRGYAWGERQVRDFIDDIERAQKSGGHHFTGTLVANEQSKNEYEVIDGQQRLTTTVLLLVSICDLDRRAYADLFSTLVQRGDVGNERLVLEPNAEIKSFFRRRIIAQDQSVAASIAAHDSLLVAKAQFDNWLHSPKTDTSKVLEVLLERFFFILFSPPSSNEAGLMFEVINNRGKVLSQLEKIKNYLIYFATIHKKQSLRENVNEAWARILQRLSSAGWTSSDDEDRFLRNCYLVFFETTKSKSWDAYGQLKEAFSVDTASVTASTKRLAAFVEFLDVASDSLAKLQSRSYRDETGVGKEKRQILRQLHCHPVDASILPLYLSVTANQKLPEIDELELLSIIERLNFRTYVLPRVTSRADSGQGELFGHAFQYFNGILTSRQLKDNLLKFTLDNCSLKSFVEHLTIDLNEEEDYYTWQGIRYFLARWEEYLQLSQNKSEFNIEKIMQLRKDAQSGDYLSVEHIWARKNKEKDFELSHIQKRRLGNFVLLELAPNIKLSSRDIPEKIDELESRNMVTQARLCQVHALREYLNEALRHKVISGYTRHGKNWFRDLSTVINDLRESDMIRFALKTWSLPGEDTASFKNVDSFRSPGKNETYWMRESE